MLKICDAIMGSGKTSATISYINAHPEKRFLYITPYLPEARRIKDGCPDADFAEPSERLPQYGRSKARHTLALIDKGRNIASTHQAMMYYTEDTFRKLKEQNYCVIIDEEINVLQEVPEVTYGDVQMAIRAGYVYEAGNNEFRRTDVPYGGGKLSHMFRIMESRPLVCMYLDKNDEQLKNPMIWYWIFSPELFRWVDDIIVMTYLFNGSEMDAFLKIHNIDYQYIGVVRTEDGRYEFSEGDCPMPEYTKSLNRMIHIDDSERMNRVGNNRTALSINWYRNHPGEVELLKKNIYNFMRNRTDSNVEDRLCGTFKEHWGKIRGKGYWNSGIVFNKKATNEYRHCTALAYPVNLFPNTHMLNFYAKRGCAFDPDQYALSTMVQWIWRSAIRDGKEIWLYVPSRRMRGLLTDWIAEVSGT